jgi:hypothetical protein
MFEENPELDIEEVFYRFLLEKVVIMFLAALIIVREVMIKKLKK